LYLAVLMVKLTGYSLDRYWLHLVCKIYVNLINLYHDRGFLRGKQLLRYDGWTVNYSISM